MAAVRPDQEVVPDGPGRRRRHDAPSGARRCCGNYVGGEWRRPTGVEALDDVDPATGEVGRRWCRCRGAGRGRARRSRRRARPSPAGATVPPQQRARAVLALREALLRAPRGARRAGHRRHGQDARRRRRRGRPRDRVGRVGGGDPAPAEGRDARGRRRRASTSRWCASRSASSPRSPPSTSRR